MYSRQSVYNMKLDVSINHPSLDFVEKSLKTFDIGWNKWIDTYFHGDSIGHNLFSQMNKDIPIEYNPSSPQVIWVLLLLDMNYLGTLYSRKLEKDYTREILDQDGMSLAYVGLINGEWKYIGISNSCFEYIWKIYIDKLLL